MPNLPKRLRLNPSETLFAAIALTLTATSSALAVTPSPVPAPPSAPSPVAVAPEAKKSDLLWNSWYTMTSAGKTPYGYYNDRVERKDGKLAYQNQLWKMEEGFLNEERVVSFATDDESITPLLFNFVTTYRESELAIDGTVTGRTLTVKARKGKENLPQIRTSLPSKAFFSTLFPAWLARKLPDMKVGKRVGFVTLFEDALQTRYATVSGSATLQAEDEFAKKEKARKLVVDMAGKPSTWWVLPSGEPLRIEMPVMNLVITKVTEAEARRFLVKRAE